MQDNISTYRIHTGIGSDAPNVLNVKLQQTYDMLEVLSLKLSQTNTYNFYESSYGIVVGRVLANDAFGIPNAKVSIFIEVDNAESIAAKGIYPFTSIRDTDAEGVRYNLLPDEQISACYQNVGTFPNKRLVLDNNDIIEIFDKYWKYTTVTNEDGDYMLFGIPTGDQQLHVDVDLSDIGVLSQRPRDMIYKGYNSKLFESPNKFKQSKNLDSLSQIFSQNKGVYVYPYWGDTSNTEETIAITRCDIQLEYKFEPTCVFMGCIVTDQGENAIGKSCAATEGNGRMEKLSTGEGSIEMIRKTLDGKVEEYQIQGNRLIDSDGVWCYQIPMNLDYVRMDEYGNIVPTDDPNKGIPTRTRVRFRISLDKTPNDAEARKRCMFLVPNNPRLDETDYPIFSRTKEIDYEFGSTTRDEDYKDLFWNKVYTVKSFIPRLQKNSSESNRKHTGIKAVNYYGEGTNPIPYNNVSIKLSFTYRLICVITKFIIYFVGTLNMIFSTISQPFCMTAAVLKPLTKIWLIGKAVKPLYKLVRAVIFKCIGLGSDFCDDNINRITYYIGCYDTVDCSWHKTEQEHNKKQLKLDEEEREAASNPDIVEVKKSTLFTCIENQLAQDNNAVNFNFHNDWINGMLYAPLWYRKITPKKSIFFGMFRKKAKDEWCAANRPSKGLRLYQPCALNRGLGERYENNEGKLVEANYVIQNGDGGHKCHEKEITQTINNGVIFSKENMYDQTVYYYQAAEYHPEFNNNKGGVIPLFATDIVLLGSLNDCDLNGVPQFFKSLTPSTYNMPSTILFTDGNVVMDMNSKGDLTSTFETFTEATGCDWGNINKRDEDSRPDGGLFYSIGCSTIETMAKSCINLSRICEFGVYLDETKFIENLSHETAESDYEQNLLIPDGFISFDELHNIDERSMFATMNGNYLRTILNKKTGLYEYDFRHLYPNNFDGSLEKIMEERQSSINNDNITYRYNYNLEKFSKDYYKFRMGDNPRFYSSDKIKNGLPMYENSYYFYFGLNSGSTAIEKFNSQFFSNCENTEGEASAMIIETQSNGWCSDEQDTWDGWIKIDLNGISTPYNIVIEKQTDPSISFSISGINEDKIYFSRKERTDDDFEGYSWQQNETDENVIYFTNGIYTITVTDADDNTSSSEIVFNSKYLSYSTYVDNFTEAHNQLIEKFKTLCNISTEEIQDWNDQHPIVDKTIERGIGGLIGIYDIYYNNEDFFSQGLELQLEVKPSDNQKITEDDWKLVVNILSGRKIKPVDTCNGKDNGVKLLTYTVGEKDNQKDFSYIVIGVPQGDVAYDVTLTQLCNGVPENNSSITQTVTVREPRPYKLYINGIDYDIIKKFKTGWIVGGTTGSPSVSLGEKVIGWLDITKEKYLDLDDTLGENGIYDWRQNELYTYEYYRDTLEMSADDAKAKVEEMRRSFIDDMRRTFYLTCPNQPKTFTFNVQTDDNPWETGCIYREEETGEDGVLNQLVSCDNVYTTDMSISGIEIPTITDVDNSDFGNEQYLVPGQNRICYTIDSRLRCKKEIQRLKNPYFVACVNSKRKTKPSENVGVGDEITEGKGYPLKGNVSGYFGFHLIDKTFRLNMMSWSYFNDIPYYKPTNTNKNEKSLTMNGLLTGIINNGVSTSNNEIAKFKEQTLNNNTIIIETYKTTENEVPDEDAIPTKRVIVGSNNSEFPYYKIGLPYSLSDIDRDSTYTAVPNRECELTISDDNCQISDNIYGRMRVVLNSQSLNDCVDSKNTILRVSISGGGEINTMYAISTSGGDNYIVNKLTDKKYTDKDYDILNGIHSYEDYDILKYEVAERQENEINGIPSLERRSDKDVSSQVENEEDSTMIPKKGYGTTGVFTMKQNFHKAVYIVAVSENNCRCISPVYDFTSVEVQIILMKYTVNTAGTGEGTGSGTSTSEITTPPTEEGGEETTKPVTTYRFGIKINNMDNLYYFKYYDFSAEVTCTASEGNNITFNVTRQKGDDSIAYKEISENIYEALKSMANNPSLSHILVERTQVIATDYTGLRHNCFIINNIDIQEVVE